MRTLTFFVLILLPSMAIAQMNPGISEQDMENMMKAMQEMQKCMQRVDPSKMQELEKRTNTFESEISLLCVDGKRDEAQKKAIAFEKEMMNDPDLKILKKCTENMEGMMPDMPFMDPEEDYTEQHVCDSQ